MQSVNQFSQEKIQQDNREEKNEPVWWSEEYGFFSEFYMDGDNSIDGYLVAKKQMLEERTQTEVDGLINLLELEKDSLILDLPCGYGRHSIELARRNFKIVGSDLNSVFLKVAKKKPRN